MKGIIILLALAFSSYTLFFKNDNSPVFEADFKADAAESYSQVRIVGLNNFEESDLILAKNTIEKVFDLRCEISRPAKTAYDAEHFATEYAQYEFGNYNRRQYDADECIDVFVTSSDLYSNGQNVRGICYGNQIYIQQYDIKTSLVHEISHSFGLDHCENECTMNINFDDRWDSNGNPVYCQECKSKIQYLFKAMN